MVATMFAGGQGDFWTRGHGQHRPHSCAHETPSTPSMAADPSAFVANLYTGVARMAAATIPPTDDKMPSRSPTDAESAVGLPVAGATAVQLPLMPPLLVHLYVVSPTVFAIVQTPDSESKYSVTGLPIVAP